MTEDLFLSNTKNNDILSEQTKSKPQELLECNLTKTKDTFSNDVPSSLDEGE